MRRTSIFTSVAAIKGGFRLDCPGLVRVSSITGKVDIRTADGSPLQEIEDPPSWIVLGTASGRAEFSLGDERGDVTYFRANGPVRVTAAE